MKKTLMALALTLVAGGMIACGDATPPPANNANKPAPPVNKPEPPKPADNSNMAPANGNAAKPMAGNANAK